MDSRESEGDIVYTKAQLDHMDQSCYGNPRLILKVTSDPQRYTAELYMCCDPKWPEISSELLPGEIAQFQRPDLYSFEVLRQKVREWLAQINLET